MPIPFECPECSWSGRAPDQLSGVKMVCQQCKTLFLVTTSQGIVPEYIMWWFERRWSHARRYRAEYISSALASTVGCLLVVADFLWGWSDLLERHLLERHFTTKDVLRWGIPFVAGTVFLCIYIALKFSRMIKEQYRKRKEAGERGMAIEKVIHKALSTTTDIATKQREKDHTQAERQAALSVTDFANIVKEFDKSLRDLGQVTERLLSLQDEYKWAENDSSDERGFWGYLFGSESRAMKEALHKFTRLARQLDDTLNNMFEEWRKLGEHGEEALRSCTRLLDLTEVRNDGKHQSLKDFVIDIRRAVSREISERENRISERNPMGEEDFKKLPMSQPMQDYMVSVGNIRKNKVPALEKLATEGNNLFSHITITYR